jgi:putative ATP-binding cassette transporter
MKFVRRQELAAGESTYEQVRELLKLVHGTKTRARLIGFSFLIVIIIVLNALAQVRLNSWQGDLYDSVSNKNLSGFYQQLGIFLVLVAILLVLGYAQTWLHEMLKVRLRETVSYDLLDEWLRPKRVYRLPLAGEVGVHPDQRIQDDTRHLTEISVDLVVGLVHSTLLLLSFVGVLWVLSDQVVFHVGDTSFSIPGYMVWAAIAYALLGSYVTFLVGRPLIKANSDLRAAEADFRYLLVRVNEYSEAIAIYRGENDERRNLGLVANNVFIVMVKKARFLARLHWVTGGYGWIAMIAPVVLAAPGYFSGALTFGSLMMVVGAFFQVQQSLRWYVDRFPSLAEWRATLQRVISYRTALTRLEMLGSVAGTISYDDHPEGRLSLDNLLVLGPNGRINLAEARLDVQPGERILISGTPRHGKNVFFRAIAGLWVWGTGTILLPDRKTIMYMPHRPYIPLGTLREAVAYPSQPTRFGDEAIRAVIARIRLDRLAAMLDVVGRWDQELTLDEQQRIAFARAILHKPAWIIQDESLSELDDNNRKLAESIFTDDLRSAALISVGKSDNNGTFYNRVFHLQSKSPGLSLPLGLENELELMTA